MGSIVNFAFGIFTGRSAVKIRVLIPRHPHQAVL